MKIKADIQALDIIRHVVGWFILIVFTFGVGAFFFPYSFSKFLLNRTKVLDDLGNYKRMVCQIHALDNITNMVLWILLTLVTFGLAYPFYFYKVCKQSFNSTTIEEISYLTSQSIRT